MKGFRGIRAHGWERGVVEIRTDGGNRKPCAWQGVKWERWDSNPGPHGCEPCALTN